MSLYTQGYRRLLKSAKFAFGKDINALKIARVNLRQEFEKQKNVKDPETLKKLAFDIQDIDEMLRFHIVQGVKNERGNFGKNLWLKYYNSFCLIIIFFFKAVSFKEEHLVTIDANQHLQHGPELTPIEPSFVGKPVEISKVKGTGKVVKGADVIAK